MEVGRRLVSDRGSGVQTNLDRSCIDPSLGTVRFVGSLDGDTSEKSWVGIEWDSPNRGKHDGCIGTRRYLSCQKRWIESDDDSKLNHDLGLESNTDDGHKMCSSKVVCVERWLTSASFVPFDSLSESQFGLNFGTALKIRYCSRVTDEETRSLRIGDDESSGKVVEIVGMRKAEDHFSDLQNLDSIDLDGYYVNSSDTDLHETSQNSDITVRLDDLIEVPIVQPIPESFPRVQFLCLRRHLISNFVHILRIISRLPKLQVLVLSDSRIPRGTAGCTVRSTNMYSQQTELSILPAKQLPACLTEQLPTSPAIEVWKGLDMLSSPYPNLLELDLHSTGVEWADLQRLSQIFPNVKSLDISSSPQLFDLISQNWMSQNEGGIIPSLFPLLTSIMVHKSDMVTWKSLFSLYQNFPNLLGVGANLNDLDDSSISSLLPYRNLSITRRVKELGLDENRICSWKSMGILSMVFPFLSSLRWTGNPLQQTGTSQIQSEKDIQVSDDLSKDQTSQNKQVSLTGQQLSRQVVIALFPELGSLNGCSIQPTERKHAERYFLALCSKQVPIAKETDPDHQHMDRLEQIHQTRLFETSEGGSAENSSHKAVPVDVLIQPACSAAYGKPPVTKRLPPWLKVADLKSMCQRMFGLPSSKQRLLISPFGMPAPIELCEDDYPLNFYGLDSGCKILVADLTEKV